ncbi:MAG: signal transduction histidine kinase [Arenicella sp.]|jgi:signal transduction histidine kinase
MSKIKIDKISELLLEYSAGNYSFAGDISESLDEYDMIISGINMLGEELLSTNVSKDYFSSIFNAVTDLVMILNAEGQIIDHNEAVTHTLHKENGQFNGTSLNDYVTSEEDIFKDISAALHTNIKSVLLEQTLIGTGKEIIHGQFTCSKIIDRFDEFKGYLISVKDITDQIDNEANILKAVFTAEQSEQKRVADDLHDSLGQELSMTKLMISNLKRHSGENPKSMELISTCTEILDGSIKHLREICFNLMPGVLTRGGLNMAISELLKKLGAQEQFDTEFEKNPNFKRLDGNLEIVMYRITQEFINNSIKHANASLIKVELGYHESENEVSLLLSDNGNGFDMKKLTKIGENRGYQNLITKVKAFKGVAQMNSEIGKGTTTFVKFPIIDHYEED